VKAKGSLSLARNTETDTKVNEKSMYKETGCENADYNDLNRDPACVQAAVSPGISRNTMEAKEETHNFPAISIQCNQEYKML
jgi:hypothetical protein